MIQVDARGLLCPQPLMETRKALQSPEVKEIEVLVDDATALENICRFARTHGYRVEVKAIGEERHVVIARD